MGFDITNIPGIDAVLEISDFVPEGAKLELFADDIQGNNHVIGSNENTTAHLEWNCVNGQTLKLGSVLTNGDYFGARIEGTGGSSRNGYWQLLLANNNNLAATLQFYDSGNQPTIDFLGVGKIALKPASPISTSGNRELKMQVKTGTIALLTDIEAAIRGLQYQDDVTDKQTDATLYPGVDEVQQLTGSGATAGTFTITFNAETTSSLNYNDNIATIQAAIDALPSLSAGDIVVTGDSFDTVAGEGLTLTFGNDLRASNQPQTSSTAGSLTNISGYNSIVLTSGRGVLTGDRFILSDVSALHPDWGTISLDWEGNAITLGDGDIVEYLNPGAGSQWVQAHDVSANGAGSYVWVDALGDQCVYNGTAWVPDEGAGQGGPSWKDVNTSTYTLLSTDDKLGVSYTTTGTCTINLPAAGAVVAGAEYTITDEGGNAAINNITIDPNGAELIVGQATFALDGNYNSATIYSNGTAWFIK
jgi:hypothetical protein